jgi:rubrerythrin
MKTALQIVITNIVQEQRAKLIYDYFASKTSGEVKSLYEEIADQEKAHRKIFEHALSEITDHKKINMYCPICGKVISFEPEGGALGGCGYCSSKFKLTIEDGDFMVRLRD